MLQKIYKKIMGLAHHPHAVWILCLISFAESSFFPLPPDPLFITMLLKDRKKAWFLATVCTLSSVTGGWVGYGIGHLLYESLGEMILTSYGLTQSFQNFQSQFSRWGFWLVAAKGLTPIPYKVVTIACGVAGLDLMTFTCASFVARGFRFFILAGLLWFYGPSLKNTIENNLGWATFLFFVTLIIGFVLLRFI